MKRKSKNNWIVYAMLLAAGGLLGYLYKMQKEVDYEKTLTVANVGDKAYNAVKNIQDIIKILKK